MVVVFLKFVGRSYCLRPRLARKWERLIEYDSAEHEGASPSYSCCFERLARTFAITFAVRSLFALPVSASGDNAVTRREVDEVDVYKVQQHSLPSPRFAYSPLREWPQHSTPRWHQCPSLRVLHNLTLGSFLLSCVERDSPCGWTTNGLRRMMCSTPRVRSRTLLSSCTFAWLSSWYVS